ncbi:MAG: hypothetical protein ACFE95_14555 [Candidatus Hodarchaeota archaeon]
MPRSRKKKNRGPFLILVLSGLMMIWGGVGYWTGPGIVGIIGDFIINFLLINNPMLEWYIHVIVWICAVFGAFGGFSVILGAHLIYPFNKITLGKLIVGLGAGMGLISFIFLLIIATLMGLWTVLGVLWFLATNIGWMGVVLSIYGRMKVKK